MEESMGVLHGVHRLRWSLALLAALGFWMFVQPMIARAGTITVTNTLSTGTGSLRAAIASAGPGDTIVFSNSLSGMTITLASTLQITRDLTIDGSALPVTLTLNGNNATRVLKVTNNARATLAGLAIANGYDASTECMGGYVACGGGIKIDAGAAVTLTHSAVLSCAVDAGFWGGAGGGIYNGGALTVVDSRLSRNLAFYGGALYNDQGTVTVTASALSRNTTSSSGYGAGLYNDHGTVVVTASTLSGNASGGGAGGIENNYGVLTVTGSLLANNTANFNGGGIDSYNGVMAVRGSTFFSNTAGNYGGAIANYPSTLTVQSSAFFSNTADNYGGGLFSESANGICADAPGVILLNSTFSGNSGMWGGGIYNSRGVLEIDYTTIASNTALYDYGGGIRSDNDSATCTRVGSSIIAGNAGGDVSASNVAQRFFSLGYNVIGAAGAYVNFNLEFNQAHDQINVANPRLGPLTDNGGSTWTHALLIGSLAINEGNPANCPAADQRGTPRPQMLLCDSGAYETTEPQPFLQLSKSVAPAEGNLNGVITYTLVARNTGSQDDAQVWLTDTLPAGVSFGRWVLNPGATLSGTQITWNGALTHETPVTLAFEATNTVLGSLVNTATAAGSLQNRQASAAFLSCQTPITVTTDSDAGDGSLRQAVANVCTGGAITFAGDYTITLSSQLNIQKSMLIDGGARAVTVRGGSTTRIFNVLAGNVTLARLTIANGMTWGGDCGSYGSSFNCGSGLMLQNGSVAVTVTGCTFAGNLAAAGAIFQEAGRLTVLNSTFTGNRASLDGAAIFQNGGVLTIENSTFSDNASTDVYGSGGAIFKNAGTLTIRNSSLSGNSAGSSGYGGAIRNYSGTLNLYNTIMANSPHGGDCTSAAGTLAANINNLVEDGSCSTGGVHFLSGDPQLGPLAGNGGRTQTFALLPGSRAIDAGDAATCLGADQRGVTRPQGLFCDIGAYEAAAGLYLVKSVTPALGVLYHGVVTYTLVAGNGGAYTDTALLTDTLPAEADFAGWVVSPANTLRNGPAVSWTGALAPGAILTWTFRAQNNSYAGPVTNIATVSGTLQTKQAEATFFVVPTYTLTVSVTGRGVVTPAVGAHGYLSGTVVRLSAAATNGWRFRGWSGDLSGSANPIDLVIDTDQSVMAMFEATAYLPRVLRGG
jgi:uncharacterized repeat protein (TIGR01451 family)